MLKMLRGRTFRTIDAAVLILLAAGWLASLLPGQTTISTEWEYSAAKLTHPEINAIVPKTGTLSVPVQLVTTAIGGMLDMVVPDESGLLVAPDEPAFFGRSSARAVAAPPTSGEVRPVSSCDEVPAVPN